MSGIIVERMFRQGSEVKAGDPLYQIDPRPFEVEVQASKAALARAEATDEGATAGAPNELSLKRSARLPKSRTKRRSRRSARGPRSRAVKADLARATLNLDYATIRVRSMVSSAPRR